MTKGVELRVLLTTQEAEALAQFIKRADMDDFRRRAGDEEEANKIYDAFASVREALESWGYVPR